MTAEETADFGGQDFSAEEKKQKNKKTHADPEPEPLNAYQRMLVAQQAIDSMPWVKDMANSKFKSISIDAMRAGVRKACIRAGLVHVGPIGLRYEVQSRDGRIKVYTGECVFRYVNADDPDDFIEYASLGEAMDTGDKGAGKLVSNLIKTHYKTCFDIGEQGLSLKQEIASDSVGGRGCADIHLTRDGRFLYASNRYCLCNTASFRGCSCKFYKITFSILFCSKANIAGILIIKNFEHFSIFIQKRKIEWTFQFEWYTINLLQIIPFKIPGYKC